MHMLLRLFILLALMCPLGAFAEDINAGFVRGFWYSSDAVFADTPTRVYVAIRNNTGADLTGTVTFFANDKRIGTQPVSALNNRIIESWVDWEPAYGEYELRAELSRVKLSAVGATTETVDSALAAATDTLFVDYDTDRDGAGNTTDTDDDNDTVTDEDEAVRGSDPLKKDTEGDDTRVSDTEDTREVSATTNVSPDTAGGLERYLTPSRADTLLGGITTWANTAKDKLDTYREERAAAKRRADAPPAIAVNNDGFGEITRTTGDVISEANRDEAPNGIVSDFIGLVGKLLAGIMSLVLFTLSWTLGHALILQLLLLIGILGGTYFLARKMGGRPMVVKKKK